MAYLGFRTRNAMVTSLVLVGGKMLHVKKITNKMGAWVNAPQNTGGDIGERWILTNGGRWGLIPTIRGRKEVVTLSTPLTKLHVFNAFNVLN